MFVFFPDKLELLLLYCTVVGWNNVYCAVLCCAVLYSTSTSYYYKWCYPGYNQATTIPGECGTAPCGCLGASGKIIIIGNLFPPMAISYKSLERQGFVFSRSLWTHAHTRARCCFVLRTRHKKAPGAIRLRKEGATRYR